MFIARIDTFEYIFETEDEMLEFLCSLWDFARWFPVEVSQFDCRGGYLREF